jgi:hypothetical protein
VAHGEKVLVVEARWHCQAFLMWSRIINNQISPPMTMLALDFPES